MSGHPWSSAPAAQAAARRAEGDAGPHLQHRDLPATVERLEERVDDLMADYAREWAALTQRVRAIEEQVYAPVVRIDTDETIDERGGVADALPEATTGSGSDTGLRTERVTLEVTYFGAGPASEWAWDSMIRPSRRYYESVRVVPTPGVWLTGDEMSAVVFAANELERVVMFQRRDGDHDDLPFTRLALKGLNALLARDAASKETGNSVAELGGKLGSDLASLTADLAAERSQVEELERAALADDETIARLTAERDAAVANRHLRRIDVADARSERDEALARAAEAERALEAESTARARAVAELEAARAASTPGEASELERVFRELPDAVAHYNYGDPVEGPQINAADCVRWAIAEVDRLRAVTMPSS